MGRKSSNVVNAEINRLRRVLESTSKSDMELIEELQIKQTTFYRYKEKIREQNKEAWREIAKESLEEAALKVKNSLDYCIAISKDVANNSSDQRARLEAAKRVVECYMMFYRMLEKGPTSKSITIPKVDTDGTDRRVEPLGSNPVTA
jgi:hypothetical protein